MLFRSVDQLRDVELSFVQRQERFAFADGLYVLHDGLLLVYAEARASTAVSGVMPFRQVTDSDGVSGGVHSSTNGVLLAR